MVPMVAETGAAMAGPRRPEPPVPVGSGGTRPPVRRSRSTRRRSRSLAGPLSAAIYVRTTLLGAAVVILSCTVAMLAVRDVRALRIRTASPATGLVSTPVSATA